MVVRKRQIIAAALVLALGSAVFINWYYNRPSVKSANAKPSVEAVDNTGGNLGDAQLVNSSGVSELSLIHISENKILLSISYDVNNK